MDNCRIPLEVCELIIDECREAMPRFNSYPIWSQLALTCTAWVSRSQFNLLYEVEVKSSSHIDLLIRTLLSRPPLADLVRVLHVGSGGHYIPFARMPLPRLLRNCFDLQLYNGWSNYPPWYADVGLRLWNSTAITRLSIVWSLQADRGVWRYIWSLPSLQELFLNIRFHKNFSDVIERCAARDPPTRRCRALQILTIMARLRLFTNRVPKVIYTDYHLIARMVTGPSMLHQGSLEIHSDS